MRLATERIRCLAKAQGLTLGAALERAGVSRTAYYSLARRPTVLPGTVHALATMLGVTPEEILDGAASALELVASARVREAREVCEKNPRATFENVWHTLCLLDDSPVERLNRSLIRGRITRIHG